MTDIGNTYDSWVAAGKPQGDLGQVGKVSPLVYSAILSKSPKIAKKTGVSPRQTAFKKFVEKYLLEGQKIADQAAKTNKQYQFQTATDLITAADKADKQKIKEAKASDAFAAKMQKMNEQRWNAAMNIKDLTNTDPSLYPQGQAPDITTPPMPTGPNILPPDATGVNIAADPATQKMIDTILGQSKEYGPLSPADQALAKQMHMSEGEFKYYAALEKQPASAMANVKKQFDLKDIPQYGEPLYQAQEAKNPNAPIQVAGVPQTLPPKEVQQLIDQLTKEHGILNAPGVSQEDKVKAFLGKTGNAFTGVQNVIGRGLDLLNRPLYAVTSGEMDVIKNIENRGWLGGLGQSFTENPLPAWYAGLSGQEKYGTADVLKEMGLPNVPIMSPWNIYYDKYIAPHLPGVLGERPGWLKRIQDIGAADALGFGGDIVQNPLTYVGLEKVATDPLGAAVRGTAIAPEEDVVNEAIRRGIKIGSKDTGLIRDAAESEARDAVARIARSGGQIGDYANDVDRVANEAYFDGIRGGMTHEEALTHAHEVLADELMMHEGVNAYQTKLANLLEHNRGRYAIKIAGRTTNLLKGPLTKAYDITQGLKGAALRTEIGNALNEAFNTKSFWMGHTHELWNKANSLGVKNMMDFERMLNQSFHGLTAQEKRELPGLLEQGIDLHGRISSKGIDYGTIQDLHDAVNQSIWNDKVRLFGQEPTQQARNYVYHQYNPKSTMKPTEVARYRDVRKARLQQNYGNNLFTLQDAEAAGLRPTKELDRIMLAQMAEHQRNLVEEAFHRKMIEHYGHKTANATLARELGLSRLTNVPRTLRLRRGVQVYMDPEIKRIYHGAANYLKEDYFGSSKLIRHYDSIIHKWKFLNTVVNPGHHIRNMMGDAFMNYIDGTVSPEAYSIAGQLLTGARSGVRVKAGQMYIDGDKLMDRFLKSGTNMGYFPTELHGGRFPLEDKLYKAAGTREEFGRLAHFVDVLMKEGDRMNLGPNNEAGLWRAANTAAKRVNKWNIDYADLTPFERSVMRRLIPFYTWMRKATPLMIEAMVTKPGRMAAVNPFMHFIEQQMGSPRSMTPQTPVPAWMRANGYAQVSGGQEPNIWVPQIPAIQQIGGMFGGSPKDLSENIFGNFTPALSIPYELTYGRSLKSGAPISTSPLDYGSNVVAAYKTLQAMLPGNPITGNVDAVDRVNRLLGLGIYKNTVNRQKGEVRRKLDQLAPRLKEVRQAQGDFVIHQVKGGYVIYDNVSKRQVSSPYKTEAEAIPFAIAMNNRRHGK